jgi:hypothetical protein
MPISINMNPPGTPGPARRVIRRAIAGAMLAAATMAMLPAASAAAAAAQASAAAAPAAAASAADHPSIKRAFTLPPSADLAYTVKVRQRGLQLGGDALVTWRSGDNKYSIGSEAKTPLFGRILESRSEGVIDDYGIAPVSATEHRYHKNPTSVTFNRNSKTISFSESQQTYPIKGGEQDRLSAPWQLVAVARAAGAKLTPGSEWAFFVAGRRDADPWVFKVVDREKIQTGQGEVNAVHLSKNPSQDADGQQVDIWLAPSLEWYPVQIRFVDNGGDDVVEQTLKTVTPK